MDEPIVGDFFRRLIPTEHATLLSRAQLPTRRPLYVYVIGPFAEFCRGRRCQKMASPRVPADLRVRHALSFVHHDARR